MNVKNGKAALVARSAKKARFVRIDNGVVQDSRLSHRARGIMAHVLSMPSDWRHKAEDLTNPVEGVEAIRSALRELERHGYAVFRKIRGPGGKFESHWEFRESPSPEKADSVTLPPSTEKADSVKASPNGVQPDSVQPDSVQPDSVLPSPAKADSLKRLSYKTTINQTNGLTEGMTHLGKCDALTDEVESFLLGKAEAIEEQTGVSPGSVQAAIGRVVQQIAAGKRISDPIACAVGLARTIEANDPNASLPSPALPNGRPSARAAHSPRADVAFDVDEDEPF